MLKRTALLLGFIFLAMLLIGTTGCVEVEADLILNKDGTGELTSIVSATDFFFNELIDEIIMMTLEEDPQAEIKEGYSNGLKYAEIKTSFQDVAQLSNYDIYITHQYDHDKHRVEMRSDEYLLKKITLQMPGRITASNGNYSGDKVYWERAGSAGTSGLMWAESEEALFTYPALLIIVAFVLLLSFAILGSLLIRKKTAKVKPAVVINQEYRCINCNYPFPNPIEAHARFCPNCGNPKTRGKPQFKEDDDLDIELF